MVEMFIAVFIIIRDGDNVGEIRSPDPLTHEDCVALLKSDKPNLVKMMAAHGYEDVELVGTCEPIGEPV